MESLTAIAEAWLHAWNSHNLEDIMSHYDEDIVFYSPFIVKINNDPSGCIRGKAALRAYFQRALTAYPDLHFDLYHILEGVNSVVLYYKSVQDKLSTEMMIVKEGLVVEVRAHYK
ncbi:nuclear transport factor 2 family protein [Chitinophaga solisilvae]|uniref:Nuclear transport factor 2 family protein n=1 Tax=Chitinophaga solisilvae TaxID=1233460 RepID=A0A3S1AZV9_9BACT|nr:nuclear transport factor 2 family protein [Chitinophaga solisilvae]NSL88902.1 nuclear transport factor 2 family protein [Chitinophaga solisilvae]